MGDSMTMGDFATFMTVEVLMSAYGTLARGPPPGGGPPPASW
jgi:hypothetical protein